jgi:hypothetical protein
MLDRHYLGQRPVLALAAGDIGPVRLKLSLDLDPIPREGWTRDSAKFANHFRNAAGKTTGHEIRATAGNRVLSVDLGVGTFAACSVFSLTDSKPPDGRFALPVEVGGRSFWAMHERSFHLKLTDELPDGAARAWRRLQDERLRRLRRALNRYRRLLGLARATGDERARQLQDLRTALDRLQDHAVPDPIWAECVDAALAGFRTAMNDIVRIWRREGRARTTDRQSGPSMWAIQHLSDIRRLLLGWSLMGRRGGDVRRQARVARGIFASRLLGHIDALKENRL